LEDSVGSLGVSAVVPGSVQGQGTGERVARKQRVVVSQGYRIAVDAGLQRIGCDRDRARWDIKGLAVGVERQRVVGAYGVGSKGERALRVGLLLR